jgi:hypothetical protein
MTQLASIVTATTGALAVECLHWYSLREKLAASRYRKLFRSPEYWIVTVGMIVISGIASWIWLPNATHVPREYFLTGAAFPLLLKKTISAVGNEPLKLGAATPEDQRAPIGDYFRIN